MRDDILVVDEEFVGVPENLASACLLASDGLFEFHRLNLGEHAFFEVTHRLGSGYSAEGMNPLGVQEFQLRLCAPKIPREQVLEVVSFFREVYREHKSEAIVFLYFSPHQGGKWRFAAVPQEVSGAHLDWKTPGAPPAGWYLVGSFHSHHTMSAFHSGTDDRDEMDWPGVHVTIGKIFNPTPEYAASVVVAGKRFKITQLDGLFDYEADVEFPEAWLDQVRKYTPPKQIGGFVPVSFATRFAEFQHGGSDDEFED